MNPGEVSRLVAAAKKHSLTYVSIADANFEVEFELQPGGATVNQVAQRPPPKQESAPERLIKSQLVGYFRPASALEGGTALEPETLIGTIEALGLLNEVYAGVKGTLDSFLVQEGAAVQFGQPLAKVTQR